MYIRIHSRVYILGKKLSKDEDGVLYVSIFPILCSAASSVVDIHTSGGGNGISQQEVINIFSTSPHHQPPPPAVHFITHSILLHNIIISPLLSPSSPNVTDVLFGKEKNNNCVFMHTRFSVYDLIIILCIFTFSA